MEKMRKIIDLRSYLHFAPSLIKNKITKLSKDIMYIQYNIYYIV